MQSPNTCNGGERIKGGSITWMIDGKPGSWFGYSQEGGSIHTPQVLRGVYPHTGYWEPDGVNYRHNMDLLAEEPKLLSKEPFRYQFKFREEAVWDDGTPISADDWEVSWKLGTSDGEGYCTGCRSRSSAPFDVIENVEGSDGGKTVTVTLKEGESDPEWFTSLGTDSMGGGLLPAHVAKQNGFDVNDPEQLGQYFEYLNDTMPTFSGGPYRLVEGDLDNQVIKEPNDNWYGEIKPTLETVIIRFLDEESTWIPALRNGEIHGASPGSFNEDVVRALQEMPNVRVSVSPGPAWIHLDVNLDNPWLADVQLRRAIFTAIDTKDIADRVFGQVYPDYTLRTNHVFREDSRYHVDHLTPTGQGSGDTEKALSILREAGYQITGSNLTKDGEAVGPLRLRGTSSPATTTSMELIQSYLAEIGIKVTIEPTDDRGATLAERDYDLMQFGWSSSPSFTGNPTAYWHSASEGNFGGYHNPEVDRLADAARSASSLEEAARHANEATRIVVSDAYSLPMFDQPASVFVTDEYVNVRDNSATSVRALYNAHEWGLRAQ